MRLRGAMWVVSGVSRGEAFRHHLVDVVSVDGPETLRVVWEVERGTRILDRVPLPTPEKGAFDEPREFDAFLDAVEWGAITSAEPARLQSPFRAGIRIEDYQLVPLLKALDQPRANMLIADDVGLGKTIETGIVLHEFVLRNRIENCLVVCPASLTRKWQREMDEKFGLDFWILDTAEVGRIRRRLGLHVNPMTAHPWLIASIDWLKRPEREPMLDAVLPTEEHAYPRRFDALVVDEAHHIAPKGDGNWSVDTQQTRLVKRLSPHYEHKFFLTATPHNGKPESFQGLLAILDRRQFVKGVTPTREQLDRVMIRRLKSHVTRVREQQGGPAPFARRVLHPLSVSYTDSEHDAYAKLNEYARSRRNAAGGDPSKRQAAGFVTLLLKKRFLSSPRAFADTLETHIGTALGKAGQRRHDPMTLRDLYDDAQEGHADHEELDRTEEAALSAAMEAGTELTAEQAKLLDELRSWAIAHRNASSPKAEVAMDWLRDTCLTDDGDWNNERVVIFTEYRATLRWFLDRLKLSELPEVAERIRVIDGTVDEDERAEIMDAFNADPGRFPVRVLLGTDAASEGVDLHMKCHRVLHLDIPFSPTKLEQRNGRIDRHGQTHPTADVFHFTADEDADGPATDTFLLDLIVNKVETIREDLGDVNELLAVDEDRVSPDDVRRDLEAAMVSGRSVQEVRRGVLEVARKVREGVEQARAALASSRQDMNLTPAEVAHAVNVALRLENEPELTPTETEGIWEVPRGLSMDWQEAVAGLADPYDRSRRRPVTFNSSLSYSPLEGPVYLHLSHPLVARATELLRAQVWGSAPSSDELNRVTARLYDDTQLSDDHPAGGNVAVVAHARVVITGGDGSRLHESVVAIGGRHEEQWARFDTLRETREVWAARRDEAPEDPDRLVALWPEVSESLLKGLYDRGQEVARQMSDRLDKRRREEEQRFRQLIDELSERAEESLGELRRKNAEAQQAPRLFDSEDWDEQGWDDEQIRQLELDIRALRSQVEDLADIADEEIEAVRRRYDVRDPRVFPMSVTFLVPASTKGA